MTEVRVRLLRGIFGVDRHLTYNSYFVYETFSLKENITANNNNVQTRDVEKKLTFTLKQANKKIIETFISCTLYEENGQTNLKK